MLQAQIRYLAYRQAETAKIKMVFQCYKPNVTFQQTEELVNTVEQRGYDYDCLYPIFSSGKLPNWLEMIIRELEVNWQLSGE
jgi:hypothetical protein